VGKRKVIWTHENNIDHFGERQDKDGHDGSSIPSARVVLMKF